MSFWSNVTSLFGNSNDRVAEVAAKAVQLSYSPFYQEMKYLIAQNGGNVIDGKPFLFGIRDDSAIDKFNDRVGILHQMGRECVVSHYWGSTDPGLEWVRNPWGGSVGAAMLCLGVYTDVWRLGNRKSFAKKLGLRKFDVFRQDGSRVRITKDVNKDGMITPGEPVKEGNFEIQFHPMSYNDHGARVGRFSAGCQGPRKMSDFMEIREICEAYNNEVGGRNRFSYALFHKDNSALPMELQRYWFEVA